MDWISRQNQVPLLNASMVAGEVGDTVAVVAALLVTLTFFFRAFHKYGGMLAKKSKQERMEESK